MEDVTRKRLLRRLETLPEEQLYQVLDYIEFLEAKYARASARKPDAFQQFAERVEDQMRVRALAPRAMRGTMRVMSTASKVLDGVRDLGRGLVAPDTTSRTRAGEGSGTAVGRPVRRPPPSPAPSPSLGPTSAPTPGPRPDSAADPARDSPPGPGPDPSPPVSPDSPGPASRPRKPDRKEPSSG